MQLDFCNFHGTSCLVNHNIILVALNMVDSRIGCSWLLSFLHQSSWTKFAKFFLKLSLGEPNGHHLGKICCVQMADLLGKGLLQQVGLKFFWFRKAWARAPIGYVFFHWQSRKEEIQISGRCLACGIASATSLSKIVQERLGENFGWPVLLLVTKWFW